MKKIDWMLVFLISLIVASIAFVVYVIYDEYRWKTLADGRIYRLNHTCLSSHIENQYVQQTSIDPNTNLLTTSMVLQTITICDYEIVDTIWKENK
jgi:hypothetical protein